MFRALVFWLLRWFIGTGHVDCRTSQPSWLINRLNILVTIRAMNILVTSFTKMFKRYSVECRIMMLPIVVIVIVIDDDDDDDGDDDDYYYYYYYYYFNALLLFCLLFFLLDFVRCLPLGW
jgi:hypothetical protein